MKLQKLCITCSQLHILNFNPLFLTWIFFSYTKEKNGEKKLGYALMMAKVNQYPHARWMMCGQETNFHCNHGG
jgi:hypothetical protein